ncbi:MAG: hypothetical protein KC550_06040, partial [Nanoarchaeota archaeon]|nr:hypothetical protein [Nanoarchaeota archaeon]
MKMPSKNKIKLRLIFLLILSLLSIYYIPNSLLVTGILLLLWFIGFYPIKKEEYILFFSISIFFSIMDLVTLSQGIFEFKNKDFILMPYFEIFLWGFYFLFVKRFVDDFEFKKKSFKIPTIYFFIFMVLLAGIKIPIYLLILVGILFFSSIYFFHEKIDIMYIITFLILGIIIE